MQRILQIDISEAILAAGFFSADEQVSPVVGDAAADEPLRMIGALVNELVLRLIGAERVVVDLLILIGLAQGGLFIGLRKARVEESLVVLRPARAGEFHPLNMIGSILPVGDTADAELMPIRPGGSQ